MPAIIFPFLHTTPLTDAVFCTLAVLHGHWGIEAIVVDYIRCVTVTPMFVTMFVTNVQFIILFVTTIPTSRPVLFGGSTTIPNICVA